MSTRTFILAFAALATLATSVLAPGSASASGQGHRPGATTEIVSPGPVQHPNWGYGRYGWCYWHPYQCRYRAY